MKPVLDPASTKYPDRQYRRGRWSTLEQIEKARERDRSWRKNNPDKKSELNAQRLYVGRFYLGTVGFTDAEKERMLNGTPERP